MWQSHTFIDNNGQAVPCIVWTGTGLPTMSTPSAVQMTGTPTVIPNTDTPTVIDFSLGSINYSHGADLVGSIAADGVIVQRKGVYLALSLLNAVPDGAATAFRCRIYVNGAPIHSIAPYDAVASGQEGWVGALVNCPLGTETIQVGAQ